MKLTNLPFNGNELLASIESSGQVVELPKDTEILRQGQYIKVIPIVLEGAVSVYRCDEQGKEVFLYTIEPSQTCAMTLQCCQLNEPSQIFAKAITETKLLTIPVDYSTQWMEEFNEWKQFVFRSYNSRFKELLNTIDGIAFQKLDERLLTYLEKQSKVTGSNQLELTHQTIANDLSSSREVISRLLKKMEKDGVVLLSRNKIELM